MEQILDQKWSADNILQLQLSLPEKVINKNSLGICVVLLLSPW
jgi:hypothetical protein